jgi:hypothetical protein
MYIDKLEEIRASFIKKCTAPTVTTIRGLTFLTLAEYYTFLSKLLAIGYSLLNELENLSADKEGKISDKDLTIINALNHLFYTIHDFFGYCGHRFDEAHAVDHFAQLMYMEALPLIKTVVENAKDVARRNEAVSTYARKAGVSMDDIATNIRRIGNYVSGIAKLECLTYEIIKTLYDITFSNMYKVVSTCLRVLFDPLTIITNPDAVEIIADKLYAYEPDQNILRACKTMIRFAEKLLEKGIIYKIHYEKVVCHIYKDRAVIRYPYRLVYIDKVFSEYWITIPQIYGDVYKTLVRLADKVGFKLKIGENFIILTCSPKDLIEASVYVLPFIISLEERLYEIKTGSYKLWRNVLREYDIRKIVEKHPEVYDREVAFIIELVFRFITGRYK